MTSAAHRAERLGLVVNEWARLDPAAAAAALPSLTKDIPPFIRSRMTSEVLEHWYARDPAAARNWAAGTADPEERAALLAAADALAATTPAAKTAALLASPKADRFTLANTFADWLNAEPHAAVEKLASIPADDRFWQDSAADVAEWWVLNAHGEGNPEKYLEAIRAIPVGPQRETLLRGLADYGASNDIPFALRIISEMSEGRDRDQAVSSVAALWMRRDPVKTSEWLATLPVGSDSRNTGVACFAEGLATDDPERAAQWAASLPDSYNGKAEVMKTVLEKWRARDPAAAQAWTARP